jgi:hypothetical protein
MFFEMGVVKTWNKVCDGIGGNFIGQGVDVRATARALLKDSFGNATGFAPFRLTPGPEKKKVYPKLFGVQGTKEAWQGLIKPNAGQQLDDYTKNSERFALAFQVRTVSFELAQKGCIAIKAGNIKMPAAFAFEE